MILMPQELNPEIKVEQIRSLLAEIAEKENVVVIVPSNRAAQTWSEVAHQTLQSGDVIDGVEKLRNQHVGLTVLVNRYDGIDLPYDACRVLAIVGLPEVTSLVDLADMAVLADSESGLRRQMQRVEQGMGRGVRSNDDYCVVLLIGSKLTRRAMSPEGLSLLTPATQAQLELTRRIAKQLEGVGLDDLKDTLELCLGRDSDWIRVSKKALLKAKASPGLILDEKSIAIRQAFDLSRAGDHKAAADRLSSAANSAADDDEKAWLLGKCAAARHHISAAESQKTLLAAHRLNPNVVKPLEGVAYQKLSRHQIQAAAIQSYHKGRFLEATDRLLYANEMTDDLRFLSVSADRFEAAIDSVARFIGIEAQRPERQFGEGPDNLWALPDGSFLIIECKNGATSDKGISKSDLGQLNQSMSWFAAKYPASIGVPVIVHPLRTLGEGATAVADMRVVTEKQLGLLRIALGDFAKSLGDADTLNNVKKIGDLISPSGFSPTEFLKRYTKSPR